MKRSLFNIILALGFILTACGGHLESDEPLTLENGGAVSLKLGSARTRAVDVPVADQFLVTFTDASSKVVFAKPYPELPYAVVLPQGNYHATAEYGEDLPFSLTTPYYRCDTDFEVEIGQTTYLDMQASLHSYIVQINYVSDFAAYFDNYFIQAEVGDTTSYSFAENTPQSAYLAPGSVRLVLRGTLKGGEEYSSVIADLSSQSGKRHTCKLTILPKGHLFELNVDRQITDVNVSSTVPDEWLPDMPAIASPMIENFETADLSNPNAANVALSTIVSFKDVCFAFGDRLKSALGITADTLRVSNADDMAALTAAGIDFEQGGILGKKSSSINLSRMVSELKTDGGVATDFDLKIKTVDVVGKTTQGSVMIRIAPPVFTLSEISAGDAWSKTLATLPAINVVHGNAERLALKYQYSKDNATWNDVAGNEISNLSSNATYFVRTIYRDYTSNVVQFKTESTPQLPNGDMEDWKVGKRNGWNYPYYEPWNSLSEWWNTSNPRGFTYGGAFAVKTRYNTLCGVLYTPYSKSGSKAAEIRSVKINVDGRSNVCGKLLIGSLTTNGYNALVSGNNNPEYIGEGREFTSRPTKVNFWFKYDRYGSDNYVITVRVRSGDQIIAENVITGDAPISEYTFNEIELNYLRSDLPATSLYICFASSKNDGFDNRDTGVSYPDWSGSWDAYMGSVLNIDDVKLVYDK